MKLLTSIKEYLDTLYTNTDDQRIIDSINIRNIRNVYVFSLVAGVLDVVTLVLFVLMNRDNPRFLPTVINVGCCVAACVIALWLSGGMLRKARKTRTISSRNANILVSLFYMAMSAWGIGVDLEHYALGEQMLTFYIVQFCFVCFVVMRPRMGSLLIALSFSAMFVGAYVIDKASHMQPQNYVIFSVIAILGNAIQYISLQESEQSKLDILELNHILKLEASVDDLTKLKNRKALSRDFERHVGNHVYIVMADVDHFKNYNDTYGHLIGDMVLKKVASATMEAFAGGDAYRYGGDEFLILLADCTDELFIEKIDQWKAAIRAIQIPNVNFHITCSFGYDRRMLTSPEDLRIGIKAADDRLYEAKKQKAQTT